MSLQSDLEQFAIAVKLAQDLRKLSPHNRPEKYPAMLRAANLMVQQMIAKYLPPDHAQVQPGDHAQVQPGDQPAAVEMPTTPPVGAAPRVTEKPRRKKRGGQHND